MNLIVDVFSPAPSFVDGAFAAIDRGHCARASLHDTAYRFLNHHVANLITQCCILAYYVGVFPACWVAGAGRKAARMRHVGGRLLVAGMKRKTIAI